VSAGDDDRGGLHDGGQPAATSRAGRRLVFVGCCVVVFVLGSVLIHLAGRSSGATRRAGTGAATRAGPASPAGATPDATADAEVVSCGTSALGYAAARLAVTNHGAAAMSYLVTVAFRSPDGREKITSATTAIERVPPGRRSATVTANSVDMVSRAFVCRVSSARAYAPQTP